MTAYECTICGYSSNARAEFVEFMDPVKLPKIVDKAKAKGRLVRAENVKYLCVKCSAEMYKEEVSPPRSMRATCPRCGEVVEVWV